MVNVSNLADLLGKLEPILSTHPLERVFQVMQLICETKTEGQFRDSWVKAAEACGVARYAILDLPKPVGRGKEEQKDAKDSQSF